jgi:hypothetical protein
VVRGANEAVNLSWSALATRLGCGVYEKRESRLDVNE